jgi:Protein of unknown function (DUF3108)
VNALRGGPLLGLSAAVLLAHLWVVDEAVPSRLGEGAANNPRVRIEVSFVRELAPSAPPAAAPVPPPRRKRLAPAIPAPAASAPELLPERAPEPEPLLPEPLPALAELAPPLPDLAASAPAAAASAPAAFEWPPSTRLSYRLTGNVRGPVEGQARVEWLRAGTRYQVFMEASVGPSFAPLFTRRDSSEGEITPEGLSPRRYELASKVVLRDPRRATIELEAERIRLPSGAEHPRPPGVQDAVSQFVHLTWLFTTQPELLTPGRSIEVMLALPRRIESWTYDVVAIDSLDTAFGRVDAVHVKPRRPPRPGGDYAAEMWVAPTLQYLPVRIIVRQDAESFVDLMIERLPQQADEKR